VEAPRATRVAAGIGAVALAALLAAHFAQAGPTRRLPLPSPRKLTAGPLLGVVGGASPTSATRLTAIDPATLRPSGGPSLRLPFLDAWALSPNRHTIAIAVHPQPVNEPNSLDLVRLPGLDRERLPIRFGGDVSALSWTSPHRVVALVGTTLCCGDARLRAVAVDLRARRIVWRRRIAGTVVHLARLPHGLALLTAPAGSIGTASLVVVRGGGIRTVRLPGAAAGLILGGGGVTRWREPGLAVDDAGRHAFVAEPDRLVVEVDLATLAVSSHRPSVSRPLLGRLAGWLQPTASAKGDSGPVRQAQWLGDGYLLVTGVDQRDNGRSISSDPAGIELVDTRDWTERMLAPGADAYQVADGLLLATGTGWRYGRKPHGIGLVAYGRDGARRFRLFAGRAVDIDRVSGGRAYVGGWGWKRVRVVDLRSGRVIGTTKDDSEGPLLLLGAGDLDDY
jgi:hypothetical protein